MRELLTLSAAYEKNFYSQDGEDGVIAAICSALDIEKGTAVEFGAADGIKFSNTAHLREQGWKTCLIEGDEQRFAALSARLANDPSSVCVKAWVTTRGEMTIDALLARHFPGPIDLMSIDIDGDDYHIFASLERRPRIILIEFNPTIPPVVNRVNPLNTQKGSSLLALTRLAAEKSYDLVHATQINAFFIDSTRNDRIRPKTPLEAFRWDGGVAFVIRDYDGENWFAVGGRRAHKVTGWDGLRAAHLTAYPKFLLGYGRKPGRRRRFYRRFIRPLDFVSPLLRSFARQREKMHRLRASQRDAK